MIKIRRYLMSWKNGRSHKPMKEEDGGERMMEAYI